MNWKGHFINGKWVQIGDKDIISKNPADNSLIWDGLCADASLVESAVLAAQEAFPAWSRMSLDQRMDYILKYEKALKQSRMELARIISMENGKPLWESSQEVITMIDKISVSAKAYRDRCKMTVQENQGYNAVAIYRPIGAFAVIGPFNLPGHLPNGHIIPALIAGNTVVFKPSELTPMTGEKMTELWTQTGLPDGVINLIQGGVSTGAALCSQTGLNGILFTGSYETGKKIHQALAGYPEKILALEMGGNNPLIVWDFESVKSSCYLTILSGLITSGQRCSCARRIIIPDSADGLEFIRHLKDYTIKICVGAWNDEPEPFMGPLINEQAAEKIIIAFESLQKLGGEPVTSTEILKNKKSRAFVSPGIIDMTGIDAVPDVENFGPLLQIYRVRDFDEAIDMANRTAYGLSAGLISRDEKLFEKFLGRARAGIVNWNRPLTGASSSLPFGGIGKSGNYRPSAFYSADYCSYAVASLQSGRIELPGKLNPGLEIFGGK